MQDKNSTHRQDWNEQFVDHGWAQMRQMLDTEMPVSATVGERRKRRGFFVLLFFLGVLLVGGALSWLVFNQPAPTPEQQQAQDIARLEQQGDIEALASTDSQTVVASKEADTNALDNFETSATALSTYTPTQPKQQQQAIQQNQLPVREEQKPTFQQQGETLATLSPNATEEEDTEQEGVGTEQNDFVESSATILPEQVSDATVKEEVTQQQRLEAFASMPASYLQQLDIQHSEQITSSLTSSLGKWTLGIAATAGVQTERFNQIDGYTAGVQLALQPRASRWAIQTGLSYVQLQKNQTAEEKNLDYFNGRVMPEREQNGGVVPDFSQYSNTQPAFLKSSITNLQYLSLPVAVRFSPISRLQVHGGVAASYLFSAKAYNLSRNQLNVGLATSDFSINESNIKALPDENIPLQKWDVAGQLGVSYFPVARTGINLAYNHGLNSYIQTTDAESKSYNRYWQLSVLYRLQ